MKTPKKAGKDSSKKGKASNNAFLMYAKTYFLTYTGKGNCDTELTKEALANYLLKQNPRDRSVRPENYLICQQTYETGEPHFHVILVFAKRKEITAQDHFDYLGVHPNIQIMRNMKAALDYVYKEDLEPITNMDVEVQKRVAQAKSSRNLYQLLQRQMLKDVFNFDVDRYLAKHKIFKQVYKANYAKALTLIRRAQPAYAREILQQSKPGIKFITPALIQQNLNPAELQQYYSLPCYQLIIDHINQIHTYPNTCQANMAPSKTPHLLIVGLPSIGKSALVDHRPNAQHPYPGLMHYYNTYHMSIGQRWFPRYHSFDYQLVRWNEFTIVSDLFPKSGYNRLLDYLEGAPSALPQKGGAPVERRDNPKHILTSNRTLTQHIDKTFASKQARTIARKNLGTRVDCVVIPKDKEIHFLRKLFIPNDKPRI